MKYLIIILVFLVGCSDTDLAGFSAIGNPGKIVCYSAGFKIFEGSSTGKIQTVLHSDGWQFKDALTGKLVRISGDCVIRN